MNTFGYIFRIQIFGESHGTGVGVVIDGCPAGISLQQQDFNLDLSRRKSGKKGTTKRKEKDYPLFISGVYNDKTTGSPVTILFKNKDTKSHDYKNFVDIPRPGHADFSAQKKYNGYNDPRGGGHFSGRLTLGIVCAGVIAKKLIAPVLITAKLIEAGGTSNIDNAVQEAVYQNDSIGGIIECKATSVPVGLGEPFFNSVESLISHIIFSIPGVKGIEFGSGFKASRLKGSEHNDSIVSKNGETFTNNAGGINGGISNGNDIYFRVAVKPTSSIHKKQSTINLTTNKMAEIIIRGRHDACFALRAPVIVEAATAIVLADLFMQLKTSR